MTSVYKNTATKDIKSKVNAIYAFGRNDNMHGADKSLGGYAVFVLRDRFVGQAGDLKRTWEIVEGDMTYENAVRLMNKRVHHKAYN